MFPRPANTVCTACKQPLPRAASHRCPLCHAPIVRGARAVDAIPSSAQLAAPVCTAADDGRRP